MFYREFIDNKVLQAALAVLTFCYFIVFYGWVGTSRVSPEAVANFWHTCPRYLQNCEWSYVLQPLPLGYTQTTFYMLLFGLLIWVVYLLYEHKWKEAQLVLIIPFLWHALHVFVFSDSFTGNYEYYLVAFGLILIFFPHKEFFLKLTLVMFYVLSTVAKIHPAWIEGGYFTNLSTGLPLFPDWSIPLWTNLVILMEMVGAWFLLSSRPVLQRTALVFFALFHLYSGILVEYRYPATVLPMLLVVFGPWYRYTPPPLDRRSIAGWTFIALLIVMQLLPRIIPGDEKLTLEGNKYGLYMFESNHQCISTAVVYRTDGTSGYDVDLGTNARNRCDPYPRWFRFNSMCERSSDIERIAWTLDHSINGGPFMRIVDIEDVCSVDYHPFWHNNWIKDASDNPPIIGWPVKNYYE